ncbi:FAD:protein FMN transferase [Alteromonas ponticola]|uniref:FAD:protein FMN transferase n=1 Tax=Alteromonas aquimaris TaxID=2998417 RepID=A0ABT3P5Z0_9ALTE|nr:FAD:protein FMN transferase [Alteromonas aquimaris]MCW8107955.1 FAD:protein FMN transferase [Alteromonas aquimaris]
MTSRTSLISLMLVLLVGCRASTPEHQLSIRHADSVWQIAYETHSDELAQATLEPVLQNQISSLYAHYSLDGANSWVHQFNRVTHTEQFEVANEFSAVLRMVKVISDSAQGCFDISFKNQSTMRTKLDAEAFSSDNEHTAHHDKERFLAYGSFARKLDPTVKINLSSLFDSIASESIADFLIGKGIYNFRVSSGQVEIVSGKYKKNNISHTPHLPNAYTEARKLTQGNFDQLAAAKSTRYEHNQYASVGSPDKLKYAHQPAITVYHDNAIRAQVWAHALACLSEESRQLVAKGNNIQVVLEETQKQG